MKRTLFSVPLTATLSLCLPLFGQPRQIEVETTTMMDPVLVTQVTVGGTPVQCALLQATGASGAATRGPIVPISFADGWISQTEITLFNRTNETIAAGRLTLMYPETKTLSSPPSMTVQHVDFGIIPTKDLIAGGKPYPQSPGAKPISWGPYQSFTLRLADYPTVGNIPSVPLGPNQVFIVKSQFFFSTGLQWVPGSFMVQDKQTPGKWNNVDPTFFPGLAFENWPVPGHRSGTPSAQP
jgi:hypothetical protein